MNTLRPGTVPTPSPSSGQDIGTRAYAKIRWRILPLLLACYVAAYLDRVNVGFAKLQMLQELDFSETVYGLGAGIFFVGYVIFEVPSNLIMMRVGPRVWVSRILITWGIVSALTIFVGSPVAFYLLRFLLGVAEAGFIPAVIYYMMIWFPSSSRGRASAVFFAAIPLSGIVGGPLSGVLIHSLDGVAGLAGWQWMFVVEAAPAVVLGIVCFLYLDNSIMEASWLTPEEKRFASELVSSDVRSTALHSMRAGFVDPRLWHLSLTYFFFTMGLYGVSFWLPTIIKDSGVSDPLRVGLLTAIPYSGALLSMFVIGRSSDRLRERRWHLAVPAVVGAVGLVISVLYAHNTVLALAALTIAASGIVPCIPQFCLLPSLVLTGAAAAVGLAVINSVGSVAGLVSPYLLGWVKDLTGSTNAGILVLACTLLIGAALVFAIPARYVDG